MYFEDKILRKTSVAEDGTEVVTEVPVTKNVQWEGVIILSVPQVEEEQEITFEVTQGAESAAPTTENKEEKKEEEVKAEGEKVAKPKPKQKTVVVMVDMDQQERSMTLNPRNVEQMGGKSFLYINKYAQKAFREELLDHISR